MNKSPNVILTLVAFGLTFLAGSRDASALAFTPTEQEWNAWTDLCRARYVVSGAGIGSKFARRISKSEVARQEAVAGQEAWHWLHHYCAGLVYILRAQRDEPPGVDYWLREADVNIQSHYHRLSKTNPMFPEVVITLARLYREMGDKRAAIAYLDEAMTVQPEVTSPYALAAIIYRDSGDLDSALDVLQRGNTATAGGSAEIHFLLGHIYIDRGDLDSAAVHAERAYKLGYPLPGLASKLRRLGRPIELGGSVSDSRQED